MTPGAIDIWVNGTPRPVAGGATVAQLLRELRLDPKFVAVERNLQIVSRETHAQTTLAEGDRLEIVTLVGGG